ncbi:MAG: hypothetical protein EBS77_09855 [Gammaproteobacteria bacterium]|nr:hypothetical protein [Gammaproteobacteria bacterium]
MGHPPDLDGPLPDIYRSREAFFASLPAWRRFLAKLNWHPIIDLMVERYAREQEDARRRERLASSESSPPGDALLALITLLNALRSAAAHRAWTMVPSVRG